MTISGLFPSMFTKEILEMLVGHKMLSLLDGFSGYNQVRVAPVDQPKHVLSQNGEFMLLE